MINLSENVSIAKIINLWGQTADLEIRIKATASLLFPYSII